MVSLVSGSGRVDACPCDLTLLSLFSRVADWPDINALFASKSHSQVNCGGISAWFGAGGVMRPDGVLSFTARSSPAIEILEALASVLSSFVWTDAAGTTWAVLPVYDDTRASDRPAYAVTYPGGLRILDPEVRRNILQRAQCRLAEFDKLNSPWDSTDRAQYTKLVQEMCRLQIIDDMVRFLAHSVNTQSPQDANRSHFFSIDDLWAILQNTARMDSWGATERDLIAPLQASTNLVVAEMRLGEHGWNPRIIRQSTAVQEIIQHNTNRIEVLVPDLLNKIVKQFRQSSILQPSRLIIEKALSLAVNAAMPTNQ